jgi:hypothetical protein
MASDPTEHSRNVEPVLGAASAWPIVAVGLPVAVAFGLLVAWLAATLGQYRAPLLFFPLATGAVLGMCLAAALRMGRVSQAWLVWLIVLTAVVVAIVGQHYFCYLAVCSKMDVDAAMYAQARQAFGENVHGQLPTKPAGFLDFLQQEAAGGRALSTSLGEWTARGWLAWLTWSIDGLLVLIPAAAMVYWSVGGRW